MHNRLTMVWGVVPGREVGAITKRYHRKAHVSPEVRAIAKAHSCSIKDARAMLKYSKRSLALKSNTMRQRDCLELETIRQQKAMRSQIQDYTATAQAEAKQAKAETDRQARVDAYLKSLEN